MKSPDWSRERLLVLSRLLRAQPPEAEFEGYKLRELGLDLLDLVADTYAQEALGRWLGNLDEYPAGPESLDAVRAEEQTHDAQRLRLIEGGSQ